jgi:hypothetical protein
MRPCVTLLLAAGLFSPALMLHAADPPPSPERLAALVERLGSDEFREREGAARALDALGGAALPALRAARKHPDAEVRRRVAELLAVIERRVETAHALEAPRLRLRYENAPLAEVLADLSKRSGNPIKLGAGTEGLEKRTVTLAGEWTFWEALAHVCAAAGVSEPEPEPAAPQPPVQLEEGFRGRRRVVYLDSSRGRPVNESEPITLLDVKPAARATSQTGALRVRMLGPRAAVASDVGGGRKQVSLTLEVKPEPRVGWERLAAVRIDRVVDDKGDELPPPPAVLGEWRLPEIGDDVMIVWDGRGEVPLAPAPQLFGMTFPVSDRTGKGLREVRGTVAAWVRTAPEPLIQIDDLAKALDDTRHGADGCRLKVAECTAEGGLYKVRIELTPPRSPNVADLIQGRLMRLNRRFVEKVTENIDATNSPFAVANDKGEALALVSGRCDHDSNGPSRVYTLVYKPSKNEREPTKLAFGTTGKVLVTVFPPETGPAKLVYRDRRTAFVEVPFVLRDVPLYEK